MSYTKKRWRILIASCFINLCIGSVYAWSVFATPLAQHLGTLNGIALTAANLTIVFTVCNSYGPVPQILGGMLIEKIGARGLLLISGILFGIGMVICSMATSIAMLIVGYSVFVGMAVGLAYGCTVNNSVKFFPDKRGLVGGIATASYGLSSVIVPVIATALISSCGITVTFRVLGILFALIICVCGCFVERCPEDFRPEGFRPNPAAAVSGGTDKNWKQMLRDPNYYVMMILFTTGCFFGMMVISQASPIAQHMIGLDAGTASIVVSILALFNVGGRIVCGQISDKIGRIQTLTVMLVLAIVGLAMLFLCGNSLPLFFAGICFVGFSYGAFLGVYPGFTADQFGARYNTTNYALMFLGMALAGIFGPSCASKIYQTTDSYLPAFLCAIVLALVGILLTFVYRRLNRGKAA